MGAKSVAKFAPDNTSKWESRVDLIGQMTRNGSTLQFLPLVSKTCGSGSSAHLEFCQSRPSPFLGIVRCKHIKVDKRFSQQLQYVGTGVRGAESTIKVTEAKVA